MATVNVSNSLVHSTGAYCLSAGCGGSHMLVHTDYVCIPTLCTSGTANFNNLTVSGNLTVQGTTTTLNTTTCTTSAMSITNAGTGPALVVNQTGSQPILDFQDDGNSSLYIEDGGYVGIGTNNPNQKLHVHNGRIAVTDGYNIGDTDANTGMFVSSDYFYIQTAGTTRLQVADNGKVGIGGAPTYTLDVNGDVRAQSDLYVGTGGGHFYNDSGSRVRINQDFYTNNSNTYIYGDNTYLGANSANDVIHTRDNEFRTRCIKAYSSCGLQFWDDSTTEYMRLWDGGTVSTGDSAGAFQLQNNSLSKNFYDNHPGAYYHAPSMIIRKDDSCTALCGIPASLVLYNNNGTCGTGTKLVFASRETAGAGNPVATAAIISRNVGGVSGSWACGDLAIMTKNRCTYCPAMCFDRLGRSYFQQDCTDWVGSNTYLRSSNEFSFLDGSNAQNARFKGIQVSDSYSGTVPNCGILFGADTCLLRSASGQLEISSTANSTLLNIRSKNAGCAMVRAGLSTDGSQATGAFEVTQDGSYGGGISYNGDASPAFASGETADHVTFYNLNAGTRTEVFHYAYNSTTVNFNATPTVGGCSVWHAGNMDHGSGLNADCVDGLEASSFVRSDTSDCVSGATYTFNSSSTAVKLQMLGHAGASNYNYFLNAANDCGTRAVHFVNGSTRSADGGPNAYTIRNDGGPFILGKSTYATCLCGNALTYNGATVWHGGNDGDSSGLDADLLDGNHGNYYLCRVASQSFNSTSCNLNCISSSQGWYNWSSQPPANNPGQYGFLLHICDSSQAQQLVQTYGGVANKVRLFGRRKTNGNWDTSWTEYWSNANDGSGSGLDADLLDGYHQTSFVRLASSSNSPTNGSFAIGQANSRNFIQSHGSQPLDINPLGNAVTIGGTSNTAWHAGNDGSGSGLNADCLDDLQATRFFRYGCHYNSSTDWNCIFDSAGQYGNVWHEIHNGTSWTNSPGSSVYSYGGLVNWHGASMKFQWYIPHTGSNGQGLYYRTNWSTNNWYSWARIWDSNNDGSGSGLDADTVDTLHACSFVRSDADDTKTGDLNFTSNNACLTLCNYGRIGIGMTDPQHPLEVCLGDNSTFTNGLVFVKNSGNRGTRGHSSGSALFQYCFSDCAGMILNKDGNVGIAEATPLAKLHIRTVTGTDTPGNINSHIMFDVADDGGPAWAMRLGDTADDGDFNIDRRQGGSWANVISLNRSDGRTTLAGQLCLTLASCSGGNIKFSAANPYICASSYIIMPGGLYVNGGTAYFSNRTMHRGGICNDSGTYLSIDGGTSNITRFSSCVGIGTTNPNHCLHVFNDCIDTRGSNVANSTVQLLFDPYNGNSGGSSNYLGSGITWKVNYGGYTKRSAGVVQIGEGNYFRSGLAFYTNGTADATTDWSERMRISMDGNVGIGTTDPGSCKLQVQGESKIVGKLHVTAAINLCNSNLCNANHITINDPGTYEGLAWNSTAGNWVIDVSPLGRTNADGNLNFYNTGSNNIALWRPQLWVYSASCYATGTANSDGSLTITSTNTGADIFSIEGSNGTLFSVADDLSDSLMSVNDAAGLPVLEVFADSSVCAGRYSCSDFYIASGGNIGIGTDSPDANHDLTIANNANYGIRFTGTNSTIQANANLIETAANMIYLRAGSSYCTMIDTGCGLAINSGCLNMCNKNIHYVNELHFNDSFRICDTGQSNKIFFCSGCSTNVRLELGSQTTGRGSLYANSGNCVGILDAGGDWAILHKNDALTSFRDSGGTERLCIGTTQIKSNEPVCINANWNEGTEPEAFTIQGTYPSLALRSTNAGSGNVNLIHVNSSGNLDFYSSPTTCGAASDAWTKRACISTAGNIWAQSNIYVNGSGALRQVTGTYGSIEVDGGATNSWEGYSIGGRVVFMHNNSTGTGIYNDVDNEWLFHANLNAETSMYHNGTSRLCTTGTGAYINQGSSGNYGLEIAGSSAGKIVLTGASSPYIRFQESSTDKGFVQWNSAGAMYVWNQEDSTALSVDNDLCFSVDNGSSWCKVWHSGNDGAGSGLDADLLDGQSCAYYRNASNLNAGTYPDLFNCCTRYNIGFIDGVGSSNRDKLRVYNSSSYTIGMQSGITFGSLNDWAMTFQMSNTTSRGFWWGDTGHTTAQGAMSLTTEGYLTVAERIRVGAGQASTSGPGYQLQVDGCIYVSSVIYAASNVIHIGDTNTYYGFHGADCWRVVTGGTERIEIGNSATVINDGGASHDLRVEACSTSTGPLGNKAYALFVDASAGAVGIGTSQPSYALEVNGTAFVTGTFSAGTKNFLIDHPTRENYMLRHGSLEGPENAVYVRGTTTSSSIELPEYWTGLVDEDSITATLTPRGKYLQLFLDRVEDNEIHVGGTEIGELYDYVVYGTRKDVEDLVVEFERPVGS